MSGKFPSRGLVSLSAWYRCPDGSSTDAVWGRIEVVEDTDLIGIDQIRRAAGHANWALIVGSGSRRVIVPGCKVDGVIACDRPPTAERAALADDSPRAPHYWNAEGSES